MSYKNSINFQITFQLRREKEKTRKKPNSHTPPLKQLVLTICVLLLLCSEIEELENKKRRQHETTNFDYFLTDYKA